MVEVLVCIAETRSAWQTWEIVACMAEAHGAWGFPPSWGLTSCKAAAKFFSWYKYSKCLSSVKSGQFNFYLVLTNCFRKSSNVTRVLLYNNFGIISIKYLIKVEDSIEDLKKEVEEVKEEKEKEEVKEGEEGEKGEGDSKETEDENKEEKKKDSRATNIRKKLSFKKSFSFLRKKAAKDAAAKEEKVEEGEKEETKEDKVEEKAEESSPKETETESSSKPEESSTEKVEDAPAPPTEAPPGKTKFLGIAPPPTPWKIACKRACIDKKIGHFFT